MVVVSRRQEAAALTIITASTTYVCHKASENKAIVAIYNNLVNYPFHVLFVLSTNLVQVPSGETQTFSAEGAGLSWSRLY